MSERERSAALVAAHEVYDSWLATEGDPLDLAAAINAAAARAVRALKEPATGR